VERLLTLVSRAEKADELLMPVVADELTDDFASSTSNAANSRRRAMTFIVVRHRPARTVSRTNHGFQPFVVARAKPDCNPCSNRFTYPQADWNRSSAPIRQHEGQPLERVRSPITRPEG